MKKWIMIVAFVGVWFTIPAQVLSVSEIYKVETEARIAGSPVISANGEFVVAQGDGFLQKVDIATGTVENIVKGTGLYGIKLSSDCEDVVYYRPSYDDSNLRHVSIERLNLADKHIETVVDRSRNVATGTVVAPGSTKVIENGRIFSRRSAKTHASENAMDEIPVVAIDRGHLMVDGRVLDPQGKGSYLWPSLSPDRQRIVYWFVGHGCFVCDIDGGNSRQLGGMRGAVWAGNDRIVGMFDRDNGIEITESKLVACDVSSGEISVITPDDIIALFPSATENRIVFCDLEGTLYYMDILK